MDVDTILYGLTRVERHCHGTVSSDVARRMKLSLSIDVMRDHLRREDAAGFNAYVDDLLAHAPDRADFLLDALYEQLGITDRAQLSALLQP